MQFIDEAIVLSASKYGENSGIACIFTQKHGIYKGMVRGITSKNQRGLYQPGNIIEATWRARLAEQLGNFNAELVHAAAIMVMDSPLKLAALSSLCAILEATLQERDSAPGIYKSFKAFISQLINNNSAWYESYVLLELELLAQLGFGLDLSECVATGALEDLIYVSPKSGRAVCRDAGQPYCDKLLKLPAFLINKPANQENLPNDTNSLRQINDGIILCGYFLDKYFFSPHNIRIPQARARFAQLLKESNIMIKELK